MENKIKKYGKTAAVDTVGNVSYSLAGGAILDYFSGLNLTGIIASRLSATKLNILTGAAYGKWREYASKFTNTDENSGKNKKKFS